ncbi:MAG: alpha-galactosidase [Lentisphaerae bacterium]|nr:alpha-galactosidase [Lentisphaerota bacterium]
MKERNSLYAGLRIGWLDLDAAASSEIYADGKKLELSWKKISADRFSAELEFGVLNVEIVRFASGIRIVSSLDLTGKLPEKVIFTPLVIPECEPDHVYFCGEKMGRTLTAKLPLAEPRGFEGRHASALTRGGETVIMTSPLVQHYDNLFRGSGEGGRMTSWRIDFELLHLDPPRRLEFDPVTVQCGDGLEIMEKYGTDNAEVKYDFSAPPEYGWNSWDYYRWTITEDEVMKNAEFIAADPVLKQHVKRIIVDDGWQYCYGEWEANPCFPGGMKKLAERLHKLGFKPGLWLAPAIVEPHCRIAQMDYDMLGCSEGGQPCLGFACMERRGFVLDPTVKKSQDFLTALFDRYAGMGYEYFKLDFLHATLTAKRFHDRSVPRCRILPMLMEAVARGVAGRAEILGCNYPFCSGNTCVRSVRVGGDIHSRWDCICHNTVSAAGLFWANKRLWLNDPDFALCRSLDTSNDPDIQRLNPCLVFCRPADEFKSLNDYKLVTSKLNEQLVLLSLVLMTGGAVNLSDNMPLLNEQGLELARKTVAAESGYACRPLDLFEHELPVYWTQKLKKGGRVLVINWTDRAQEIPLDWKRLAPGVSEVMDFWNGKTEKCLDRIGLEPHSCKLWEF